MLAEISVTWAIFVEWVTPYLLIAKYRTEIRFRFMRFICYVVAFYKASKIWGLSSDCTGLAIPIARE